MDWILTLSLMLGGLAGLLLIGLPVAFAFITVTMIGAYEVLGGDRGLLQLARNATQSVANFQMAPIPLFILMGEILFQTGIAHRAIIKALGLRQADYKFAHAAVHDLGHIRMLDSYHCSRYNTNTGRLTNTMFENVFATAREMLQN